MKNRPQKVTKLLYCAKQKLKLACRQGCSPPGHPESKKADATFVAIAAIFDIPETKLNYEWQFLSCLPMDLSTSDSLTMLCTQHCSRAFPYWQVKFC